MTQIKIISNPYERSIEYYIYKEHTGSWENIGQDSINSRLRESDKEKIFLPFKIKEIINTIVAEYYVGDGPVEIVFEGTKDEYEEAERVCSDEDLSEKVHLTRSTRLLQNARDILDNTKEVFGTVEPLIKRIVQDDDAITDGLGKVSDALKDIIPICIFGNYSSGKSTFINALIGHEILPSGGDPVTAKIYEIKRSQHEDRARITFSYLEEAYELRFDHSECEVVEGNKENDLLKEVLEAINACEKNLYSMVYSAIDILNSFEKRDKSTTLISNVIRIEVPFSDKGKMGQSLNEFVIFDTPGSNSNTNMDHKKVLTEALHGFSNGIPVWVCQYDAIDSVDNANLCEELYKIDALDKRFTMIVVNKADHAELPKGGFDQEKINDIMEFESVEKMYSGGIYFVSSVMGLGAKNKQGFISDFLGELFEDQERKYSDPDARAYKTLYEFNIMPEQMKKKAMAYSEACENKIYANSGLYCAEMEMEQFASKHAAYNKCQMVLIFLSDVIGETTRRIAERTASIEKHKTKLEQELDEKSRALVSSIQSTSSERVDYYDKDTSEYITAFLQEVLVYEQTTERLQEIENNLTSEKAETVNYAAYEQAFEEAREARKAKLAKNASKLLKENFLESISTLATEWRSDSRDMRSKKRSMEETKQIIDKDTADKILGIVVDEFRSNMIDAQERLSDKAKQKWQDNAQGYRDAMVRLITGSDVLSAKQREELSELIINYQPLEFDDEAEKVFIKTKFLRRYVLGIELGTSEKLSIPRLVSNYNTHAKRNTRDMADRINESCFLSFKAWQEKLQALIENNITTYNPELREIAAYIKEESDRIQELQLDKQKISSSLQAIQDMTAWKTYE